MIFLPNRTLAHAAAQFLNFNEFASEWSEDEISQSGRRLSQNVPRLVKIVELFLSEEPDFRAECLVESLIQINQELITDWISMTDILLDTESELDYNVELGIICILAKSSIYITTGNCHFVKFYSKYFGNFSSSGKKIRKKSFETVISPQKM
jgi:hypothetical protein